MRSYAVLREAADTIGVKALAAELKLSPALVYKWCQEWDPSDPDASGARNPLDRLLQIIRATDDAGIVRWLCHETGGFFVNNPTAPPADFSTQLIVETQRLVHEFSELLLTVTQSIEDDGEIEESEAERIRAVWEMLKGTVEAFTVACERGVYRDRKG
jgi:Phage regulatory protein CII (CP76)